MCSTCGAELREGKAFCYNCGAATARPAAERGDKPSPELFESTLRTPPPQEARTPAPTPDARQSPVSQQQSRSYQQQSQPPRPDARPAELRRPVPEAGTRARQRRPAPPLEPAPSAGGAPKRRKFFYGKFGLGVVVLLLLAILALVALAIFG